MMKTMFEIVCLPYRNFKIIPIDKNDVGLLLEVEVPASYFISSIVMLVSNLCPPIFALTLAKQVE